MLICRVSDKVEPAHLARLINISLTSKESLNDPRCAAQKVVDAAIESSSTDNCSAVVVPLRTLAALSFGDKMAARRAAAAAEAVATAEAVAEVAILAAVVAAEETVEDALVAAEVDVLTVVEVAALIAVVASEAPLTSVA
jgi:hypothetical protein